MKRFISTILFILILLGMAMSILNFTTRVYASPSAKFGTSTQVTNLFEQLIYYLQGRWMYGNYYCIGEPSDCSIVN